MPALFFPNLDALRLVLASGIVPPAAARAPGRAGFDDHGRLWLQPAELLPREALAAMARLGVQAHGGCGVATQAVGCWAELLPLRPARSAPGADTPGSPSLVLFELPDYPEKHIVFDGPAVRERLLRIVEDEDLRRYIL